MNHWKKVVKKSETVIAAGIMAAALTACGGAASTSTDGDVKTIYVGTSSAFQNDAFYNEEGELDGFEIDFLKAIDEQLPQYKFEYSAADMANTLLGMDTGKLDMGVNQFEYSDERNEKYLFGSEGYMEYNTYLTVLTESDYQSIEDLAGKVVGTPTSQGASGQLIVKYSEEHPDKAIIMDYYGSGLATEALIEGFKQGKWDALLWTQQSLDNRNAEYPNLARFIGDPINVTEAYVLFSKANDNTQLKEDVDGAIKTLKQNGTLAEISIKWFGADYTPKAK